MIFELLLLLLLPLMAMANEARLWMGIDGGMGDECPFEGG